MIGKLSGIIDSFGEDHLVLDVSGVGYLVFASSRTLARIGQVGDTASVLIITHVREDAITLFGFADKVEKEWFKLLTSVQGVGVKAGLSILAACPAEQLAYIIASQDKAALTRANGVGSKIATRILTELKDKAGKMDLGKSGMLATVSNDTNAEVVVLSEGIEQDAISALKNLGYGGSDAMRAVTSIMRRNEEEQDRDMGLQSLIRLALKELSS